MQQRCPSEIGWPLHPITNWLAAARDGQRPFYFQKSQYIPHFEKMKLDCSQLGRRRKVEYCTDLHARRGGNIVYNNCEMLSLFCFIYLLHVYCCNLTSVDLQQNKLHPVKMINIIRNTVNRFHINIPVRLQVIQSTFIKISLFVLYMYYVICYICIMLYMYYYVRTVIYNNPLYFKYVDVQNNTLVN